MRCSVAAMTRVRNHVGALAALAALLAACAAGSSQDRKSTRLNSSHLVISYAVFCLKKKSTVRSAAQMSGCDGYNPNLLLTLQPSQHRSQFYTHASYDFSDDFSAYFQVMASQNHVQYNSLPTFELSSTNFTILRDNAYLPQTVKNFLASPAGLNIASFTVGRISPDFDIPHMDAITNSGTATIGFDGKVPSSSWSYHGYGQMGRAYGFYQTQNDPLSDNLYRAADAGADPG